MAKREPYLIRVIKWLTDFLYPVFKPVMIKPVYRFCANGAVCFAVNVLVFYFSIHYWFLEPAVFFHQYTVQPYFLAWLTAQAVSIPIGFYLNYHIVFPESTLRIRTQFIRFILTNIASLLVSYVFIRFFVEGLNWYPTVSLIVAIVIATIVNYLLQKKFAFR